LKKLIIIGGSAGSFKTMSRLFKSLPENYPHTIIVCLHRLRNARTGFIEALSISAKFPICEPFDKEFIKPARAYLAPANYHLIIEPGYTFSLSTDLPRNHSRPSIDITMETAGEVFREKAYGIILSGANMDGAIGMKSIKKAGGVIIVQDPKDSEIKTMPEATIKLVKPDYILDSDKIIKFILEL
jgi:two-component system, chemotaxis family, protein-glutamate methylesterase/glutaminase